MELMEIEEELRDQITFQAKKFRKRGLTQTAMADFPLLTACSEFCYQAWIQWLFSAVRNSSLGAVEGTGLASPFISDAALMQPKRAYIQSSSPIPRIRDRQSISDSKFPSSLPSIILAERVTHCQVPLQISLDICHLQVFLARRVVLRRYSNCFFTPQISYRSTS